MHAFAADPSFRPAQTHASTIKPQPPVASARLADLFFQFHPARVKRIQFVLRTLYFGVTICQPLRIAQYILFFQLRVQVVNDGRTLLQSANVGLATHWLSVGGGGKQLAGLVTQGSAATTALTV